MTTELWVLISVGILILLGLVYFVIVNVIRAKKDFKRIDYSKIRKWEDDD